MKHLRFTTLLFLIVFLIVLLSPSSFGQSTPAKQGPASSSVAPAQPADEAWRKPVIGKAVTDCDLFSIDGCVQRHRRPPQAVQLGGPDFDPGIFLDKGKGNMCGSIVSYNFSPGDNPQLESVTTCTPADAIVTRRAQGKEKKPPAPLFRTTELSTPQR